MTGAESANLHLENIAGNLQLVADLGYGDVSLAVPSDGATLRVVADARPVTAIAANAATRVGVTLRHDDEPEAYRAFASAEPVHGDRRRITRGIAYTISAYPVIHSGETIAVVLRGLAEQVVESPGTMETVFMESAEDLLAIFAHGPILDVASGEPFSTVRRAGDGLLRIDGHGTVAYASPNAVNIMRLAGLEGALQGRPYAVLPGAEDAIAPALAPHAACALEFAILDRVLGYRAIGLREGAVVLVEDVTEARRREQEIKVKEATIREVHHRVKNNLQTIASLLRIQARRSRSAEARRALAEAMERVSSMAVVHEMLAASTEERIDFTDAAQTVVDMVRRGLAGDTPGVRVAVEGSTGLVPAQVATSLALVVAELVHNAIEHGLSGREQGVVTVAMRRLAAEIVMTVRDDGHGLPEEFDPATQANLGLAIVRTVVEDDLRGSLTFSGGRGTTVTLRFPLAG
ncbi:MAG: histidine kinase N-terminal domain-containing protein [Coriobacteriia bacterium]|nr:histidine kinase N-terminal domain-containing protein [Coriobacteriia bacterium]